MSVNVGIRSYMAESVSCRGRGDYFTFQMASAGEEEKRRGERRRGEV
jgi:hypothetical protein